MPSPVDDTIWGQAMDRGFSRIDQPGYIIRVNPGPRSRQHRARRSPTSRRKARSVRAASISAWTAWCGRCCRAAISQASTASCARDRSTARPRRKASNVPKAGTPTACRDRSSKDSIPRAAPTTLIMCGSTATMSWGSGPTCRSPKPNGNEALLALVKGQFRHVAHALSARLLHQECRRPHRRRFEGMEGPRRLDHVGHARQLPRRRRQGSLSESLQGADAAKSAGTLIRWCTKKIDAETDWAPRFVRGARFAFAPDAAIVQAMAAASGFYRGRRDPFLTGLSLARKRMPTVAPSTQISSQRRNRQSCGRQHQKEFLRLQNVDRSVDFPVSRRWKRTSTRLQPRLQVPSTPMRFAWNARWNWTRSAFRLFPVAHAISLLRYFRHELALLSQRPLLGNWPRLPQPGKPLISFIFFGN